MSGIGRGKMLPEDSREIVSDPVPAWMTSCRTIESILIVEFTKRSLRNE
jgi:hypothetical protein